jgi:hypothetical protein
MDSTALLTADHNRVRGLFTRFKEARKARLGAPTMADKEHLSVDDLRRLAQDQDIPGRSSMDREELLATVASG